MTGEERRERLKRLRQDSIPKWQETMARKIKSDYGIDLTPTDIPFMLPPGHEFGATATPICFSLSTRLRQAPAKIAEELMTVPFDNAIVLRNGGYLNFFIEG